MEAKWLQYYYIVTICVHTRTFHFHFSRRNLNKCDVEVFYGNINMYELIFHPITKFY